MSAEAGTTQTLLSVNVNPSNMSKITYIVPSASKARPSPNIAKPSRRGVGWTGEAGVYIWILP
ncbi:MAG TPA: hypothetical protein PKG82_12900, partial [Myxococcota bacterium]|nr:hypothetical protein [Myxococcota bacterium]